MNMSLKVIAVLIMVGLSAQQTCDTVQYWSVASAVSSRYPTTPIIQLLDENLPLKDISFTDSGNTYTITGIVADPVIPEIKAVPAQNDIAISLEPRFYLTFFVKNSNGVTISQGRASVPAATLTVTLTPGASLVQWTVKVQIRSIFKNQSITLVENKPPTDLQLTVNTLYSQILNALSTGGTDGQAALAVQTQIQQAILDPVLLQHLQQLINTHLSQLYGDTYVYNYVNLNGVTQSITYSVVVSGSSTVANTLVVQRKLQIPQFTNLCETALPQPGTTIDGHTASQITVFSLKQIQTTFKYALQNNFFNTNLNQKWNSPIFQFNAASLQNVLTGIQGNYKLNDAVTGACTASAPPAQEEIKLSEDGGYLIKLKYSCTITKPTSQDLVATVTFQLDGSVTFSADSVRSIILVKGKNLTASNVLVTANEPFKSSNLALATLYVQSVIDNTLNNQELFGTGFATLERQGTVDQPITIASSFNPTGVIVYDYPTPAPTSQ